MRRAILLAILLIAAAAFAQLPDFSKVEIKVQKVADGVYMLQGAGGNIGVSAGEDGFLMVDDEFAPLAPKIEAALKGIGDKPLRFIIKHALSPRPHGRECGVRPAPCSALLRRRQSCRSRCRRFPCPQSGEGSDDHRAGEFAQAAGGRNSTQEQNYAAGAEGGRWRR